LRQVFPDEPIVFVYGKQQERDYQLYVSKKYGSEYYKTVSGNADMKLGYAMASLNHIDIQHERAHLELCAAQGCKPVRPVNLDKDGKQAVVPVRLMVYYHCYYCYRYIVPL
jgi:hypothetical protein